MEDRVDDLERELGQAYLMLSRIHTWLGGALEGEAITRGLVEDAYAEAGEMVKL
jgi:hypothetical protein